METSILRKLSSGFVHATLNVRRGERVWVEYAGEAGAPLAREVEKQIRAAGASPFIVNSSAATKDRLLTDSSIADLKALGRERMRIMRRSQAYIRIDDEFDQENVRVSQRKLTAYETHTMHDVTMHRVENLRWLVVSPPSLAFAKACRMSVPEFDEFYRKAYSLDYKRMGHAAVPLKAGMDEASDVHILGKRTNLKLSIKGFKSQICAGEHNQPDGEVYTAPVKDSVNGTILFGPSYYRGQRFTSIWLRFDSGKVVEAEGGSSQETKALNAILDVDPGARYVGEFAISFNPAIDRLVGSILFDEKHKGALHLALGQCYRNVANNGNNSKNHWDMIHVQLPEYGGGEIWIDGRLIRKDGQFIVPELQGLNPDILMPRP